MTRTDRSLHHSVVIRMSGNAVRSRTAVTTRDPGGAHAFVTCRYRSTVVEKGSHATPSLPSGVVVMFAETGLLPADEIHLLATTLQTVATEQATPGAVRSESYSALEARLADLIGPVASNLHLGRSNNDLGTTMNRMRMREMVLDLLTDLNTVRTRVQDLAAGHVDTGMPGFTHSVQAQPTTLAHVLLAFDAALERDSQRCVNARSSPSPSSPARVLPRTSRGAGQTVRPERR